MAKILLVLDEPIVAIDLTTTLAMAGHEVVGIASNTTQAVSFATERRPEIVIVDVVLAEGTDGIAAARALKARVPLPVIFISASSDPRTRAAANLIEPVGFLRKPLTRLDVLRAVEKVAVSG